MNSPHPTLASPQSSPTGAQVLELALCRVCNAKSYPADVPGCRQCGAPPAQLQACACEVPMHLLNFVTLHTALIPGLQVPVVIGEVALAPGLVEEALIAVASEDQLALGMLLYPVWRDETEGMAGHWVFRPGTTEANA